MPLVHCIYYRSLSGTRLAGAFPTQLCRLTLLTSMYDRCCLVRCVVIDGKPSSMSNTMLSGILPSQLGLLSNLARLYVVAINAFLCNDGLFFSKFLSYLGQSLISGSIPSQLGHLSRLTSLYVVAPRATCDFRISTPHKQESSAFPLYWLVSVGNLAFEFDEFVRAVVASLFFNCVLTISQFGVRQCVHRRDSIRISFVTSAIIVRTIQMYVVGVCLTQSARYLSGNAWSSRLPTAVWTLPSLQYL